MDNISLWDEYDFDCRRKGLAQGQLNNFTIFMTKIKLNSMYGIKGEKK